MKAMLRDFYGASVTKVKVETKPWKIELPNRKLEIELMTLSSNFHVEMNPSDVGNNDRCVLLHRSAHTVCKATTVPFSAGTLSRRSSKIWHVIDL